MAAIITGLAYPLAVDPLTGNLKTLSDAELIQSHVISVLETELGESPMRPRYGVPGILFSTQSDFSVYLSDVQQRLAASIPQGEFTVTGDLSDDGEAVVIVSYTAFFRTDSVEITIGAG